MRSFDLAVPAELSGALAPDLVVMIGAMALLLFAAWRPETLEHARRVAFGAIAVCVAASAVVVCYALLGVGATPGVIAVDNFRWGTDLLFLGATVMTIALTVDYSRRQNVVAPESYVLLLLATSGMMVLAAARDLIIVFLGIEIMSVAVYVLAGIDRRSGRAAEAALKYFLLGAFSTGFLLYGVALAYGATGSTNIATIGERIGEAGPLGSPMLLVGMALLLVGFGFKVAAAPFHMWAPDVYEGAPTPFTAYMAAAVKAAAFAAFLRVWMEAFPNAAVSWRLPIAGLAILTMFVGNVIALMQKNIKRLLAYSSIAHAGYLLVAVVVGTELGVSAFLFYLVAYTLATMGAFGVVIALGQRGDENTQIADFGGLWTVRPGLAIAMAVCMLALLGFPIVGGMGFFAKWNLLQAALQAPARQTVLAVAIVLASVVSAGYYLYVIMMMFMHPRPPGAAVPAPTPVLTRLVIGVSVALLLFFGVAPNLILRWARDSVPAMTADAPTASPVSIGSQP